MAVRKTKLEPGDIEKMLRGEGLEIQGDSSVGGVRYEECNSCGGRVERTQGGGVVLEKCSKCGAPYHRQTYA